MSEAERLLAVQGEKDRRAELDMEKALLQLAGIKSDIAEIKTQLESLAVAKSPSTAAAKAGFWANMNDWQRPLPWIVFVIIGVAAWQGITLSEYLGAPIKVSP